MKIYTAPDGSAVYEARDGSLYRTAAEAQQEVAARKDALVRAFIALGVDIAVGWDLNKLLLAVPDNRVAAEWLRDRLIAALV